MWDLHNDKFLPHLALMASWAGETGLKDIVGVVFAIVAVVVGMVM